jgi:hypothetical protein
MSELQVSNVWFNVGKTDGIVGGATAGSFTIRTSGTDRLIVNSTSVSFNAVPSFTSLSVNTFTSTNNIVIGTGTPYAKIHNFVPANASFTGTALGGVLITDNTSVTNGYSSICFNTASMGSIPAAKIAMKWTSAGSYLSFGTSSNYSTGITNEALIIDYNGRITANNFAAPGMSVQQVYTRNDTKSQWYIPGYGGGRVDITDLNTTITPRSSTSKIMITYCIGYEVQHDTIFKLFRVIGGSYTEIGTNVNDANAWSGIWYPGYDVDSSSTPRQATLIYLDSPATTSAITYVLAIQSSGVGATYFNLNRSISSAGQSSYENAISQAFLEEIAQ